jgi:hypothetical protein
MNKSANEIFRKAVKQAWKRESDLLTKVSFGYKKRHQSLPDNDLRKTK